MDFIDHEDLRQAARDELEIVEAGLYDRYRDQLDYEIRQTQPAPVGNGPLSKVHGQRWQYQRKAQRKQRPEQSWQVGVNLAHNAGVGVDTAIAAVEAAIDDVRLRVRERFATAARLKLAGVEIASGKLPQAKGGKLPPSESAKTSAKVSQMSKPTSPITRLMQKRGRA